MVGERLARHHTPVTTVDELWYRVEAARAAIPVHAIQSLFDSMTKSMRAVISRGGGCSGKIMSSEDAETFRCHGCKAHINAPHQIFTNVSSEGWEARFLLHLKSLQKKSFLSLRLQSFLYLLNLMENYALYLFSIHTPNLSIRNVL
ncbi:unnamed protein product [Larinioides sclopetarius]|uniref:Transposase n=1 Tax=Larinioides sclopetarius TaxID=280406 RepID=A0AAV2BPN7_9ARAC